MGEGGVEEGVVAAVARGGQGADVEDAHGAELRAGAEREEGRVGRPVQGQGAGQGVDGVGVILEEGDEAVGGELAQGVGPGGELLGGVGGGLLVVGLGERFERRAERGPAVMRRGLVEDAAEVTEGHRRSLSSRNGEWGVGSWDPERFMARRWATVGRDTM